MGIKKAALPSRQRPLPIEVERQREEERKLAAREKREAFKRKEGGKTGTAQAPPAVHALPHAHVGPGGASGVEHPTKLSGHGPAEKPPLSMADGTAAVETALRQRTAPLTRENRVEYALRQRQEEAAEDSRATHCSPPRAAQEQAVLVINPCLLVGP